MENENLHDTLNEIEFSNFFNSYSTEIETGF